jgi:hypothetical protein
MATICTNFLTGNDTTGDGSPSLPYKTINKALSVAVNNDLIKVAGSDFTKLSGTITATARATTMTTSVDLTGSLVVGDVIAIDTSSVDGWDKEHTLFTVEAINSTTITITGQPIQFKAGTYDIWKFNTFHYSTSLTTAQETITSYAATTLTVSGGWSSDFNTQIGWTGVRKTGTAGGALMATAGIIKGGVIYDKFLIARTGFNAGSSNTAVGIDTINIVNTATSFGTSNSGVWYPTSKGYSTFIANASTSMNGAWNGGGNRPQNFVMKQFITGTLADGQVKVGFSLSRGQMLFTLKSSELNVRTSGTVANTISTNPIFPPLSNDIVVDNLNIYANENCVIPIYFSLSSYLSFRYINNVNVYTDGSSAGIVPNTTLSGGMPMTTPFTFNRTSGTLDDLPWRRQGSPVFQALSVIGYQTCFNGKDTEGNKVITNDGIVKYADPSTYVSGSNSLRQKIPFTMGSGNTNRILLGSIEKPSTSFTLNITLKANRTLPTTSNSLVLMFTQGTEVSEATITLASAVSITSTFQTFSYSINPASYTYWNTYNMSDLMSVFFVLPQSSTLLTDNDYIWVDSITIS